ncbi:MAG: DPP IV N-terminal domain-containing protein [Acidobacteriota bacterium]
MTENFRPLIFLCFLVAACSAFAAEQDDPSTLTLDRIFTKAEFSPKGVGGFRWLKTGDSYAKLEPSATIKGAMDLAAYDLATNQRSILVAADKLIPAGAKAPLTIQGYDWTVDNSKALIYTNSKKVWRLNTRGDYWVLDAATGKLTKIDGNAEPSTLMFAKFSPDGKRVGYVRENNIYVQDLATGKITTLTTNGSHTLINGTSDWVNEEELNLRDCWRWSPDSREIAYWQFDAEGIKDYLLINDTNDIYPAITKIPYPKVGTTNAAVRIGVVSADGGETKWLNIPGDPRNNYVPLMEWANNSDEIFLEHLNRLQNEMELMYADAKTGNVRTILTQKDEAWIDVRATSIRWLEGGKRFLAMSEGDGWDHVYSVSRDGSDVTTITPGNFDVVSIAVTDEINGWLYYIASPDNAAQRYLYRSKLDGTGTSERVTPAMQKGWNAYDISPNGRWALHNYSSFGTPARFELVDLSKGSVVRSLADNAELQTKLAGLKKGPQEFFKVDTADGVSINGWMMKPPGFDPNKKYPILFYVYGEPASQTVSDSWGGNNYLWFLMLTQQGYIVASVDNRGTPEPRGRAWRKSIYRKIGVLSSQDQAAAVKAMLDKTPYLDPSRVGVWGWSGGGSSTLNAMFRYPEIYRMGMSLAPVADMRLYDTIYQERYMGLPAQNGDDYKKGSPITFASGLKGDLLIVHGTGDDNVHYQGTEMLINELVKNNKPFTMMAYPNRTHGIFEGEGTTRHLYELLTRYLHEHLPAN